MEETPQSKPKGKIWKIVAPILAGMCLDLLDFVTAGPLGLSAGFILGFLVTFILGLLFQLSKKRCFWISVTGGIYCMLPLTEVFPCATILMTLVKLLAEADVAE